MINIAEKLKKTIFSDVAGDVSDIDRKFALFISRGDFSDIDREFSLFISRIDNTPETALAALLLSSTTMSGNVCLYLPSIAGKDLVNAIADTESRAILPKLDIWIDILQKSPAVGKPGDFAPMILDASGRLYLQRYWYYENLLALNIKERTEQISEPYSNVSLLLDNLFSSNGQLNDSFLQKNVIQPDWQKVAAAASILNRFTVISGGPGTGKTTTIAKILIALCILEAQNGRKISAAVTAPTGKAAARLMESINSAVQKAIPLLEKINFTLIDAIPTEPHTIHRLLGYRHGSVFFKHHKDNPLPYDLVIVDESSMADLPLMAKLFDAVPIKSRIILLGDNNQLSSVESGAVLGDICSGIDGFTCGFANKIKSMGTGLSLDNVSGSRDIPLIANSIVMLKKSFRFGENSGIGALSNLVNSGKSEEAISLLLSGKYRDITFMERKENDNQSDNHAKNIHSLIESVAMEEYAKSLRASTPEEAFELLTRFRILTPVRKGIGGVEEINRYVDILGSNINTITKRRGSFYNGLPVIVKRNDYAMNLYNGDIGIFLKDKDGLRVFFQGQNGFRKFMPGRLPENEIAYALTVHKSQGSEFDRVLFVVPESKSPVLTREMLYTGITRAKKEVIIAASIESIVRMIKNPVKRHSGLTEALWGVML
ncbi:MAG: exodeoxyribonuclease V subunit alpha [Desulfamplus sp.]|nr:exodeoxyribonuclease V subunit alpha [Desulfamplus sp.]